MSKRAKSETGLEDKILENIIDLQKVHTNMAEKFDKLAKEISNLLALFELAARDFSKHPAVKIGESDKEFLDKIDRLLDQNKTIAKGLTLMEEQLRKKMYVEHPIEHLDQHQEQNLEEPTETTELSELIPEGYTPSMKSNNRPLPRF